MTSNTVDNYGWAESSGPQSCNYITPKILSSLHRLGVKRVADVGSGNGALCAAIANSQLSVVGIEYDREGVEISREMHKNINFYNLGVQDDPTDIIDSEGTFEAVISTEVIEHLFSPHLLPIFASKLLNKNGKLIITTPYHGYLKNILLSLFNKWDHHHTALWHGGHIKFWSRGTLTALLEQNGFRVIEFDGVGRLPYLWKSMILIAEKK